MPRDRGSDGARVKGTIRRGRWWLLTAGRGGRKFWWALSVLWPIKDLECDELTRLRHQHRVRSLLPRYVRERAYEWHPGRARRWRRYGGVERVVPSGRAALTFDDGPDRDATPDVLEALEAASARATFFLLGAQLQRDAGLAREIVARGHEVGLHGFEHERQDRISVSRSRDDVLRGFTAVDDVVGVRCRWYRPPYGRMSIGSAQACQELGMMPVYWSAWGLDWESLPAARIAQVALQQLEDGSILLLHDSARFGRRNSALPTAQAVPMIAERAAERGISLVCLTEVIERDQ